MKKIITLTLVMVLALSLLTACNPPKPSNSGGSTTTPPSSSTTTPPASQGETTAPSDNGGKLFDITDDQIRAYDESFAQLQGEARTTMLAAIPGEMKKGVGTLKQDINTVQPNSVTGEGYIVSFGFTITGKSDYATLVDYYKSLGGTVKNEVDIEGAASVQMDFAWGEITQCEYGEITKSIQVSFTIK